MSDALDALIKARTDLVLDHPFFGSLALRMKFVEDTQAQFTKNLATDGSSVYFNPEYISKLDPQECRGLLAHTVMHPAMQHHVRRGHRDEKLWNKACDFAINGPLHDAGFKLPIDLPLDPRHNGSSAESIYTILMEEEPPPPPKEQPKPDGSDGDGDGEGQGEGSGDGQGNDGQGGGNDHAPGHVMDSKDPVQSAADWQMAVKQAAQAAQMMGNCPADIARLAVEANRPRFDVKSLLMRFAQEQCKNDYSWRMPNRRYFPQGVYLPEARDTQMGRVAIAVDSSGSITDAVMARFLGFMQEVVDQVRPSGVDVIICDAHVHAVHHFDKDEPINDVKLIGGGGTDFCPVFEHIDANEDEQPACIVYLTDGYGRFPDQPSEIPTLWVMISDVEAPWGETVRMEEEE